MMLCLEKVVHRIGVKQIHRTSVSFYSKRSDYKIANSYKVIKSDQTMEDDVTSTMFGSSPNWELLAPHGYRFFLPGSVGPAWHDTSTVAQITLKTSLHRKISKPARSNNTFKCIVQDCPVLLRKGVLEMFPGSEIAESELSIVTLTYEPAAKQQLEMDETVAKCFVLAAQEICNKLRVAGFWADFINPFSGRPYLGPFQNLRLYETDEKFRCLGFEIEDHASCKLIINEEERAKNFIGSLFTTAPSSILLLKDVLN